MKTKFKIGQKVWAMKNNKPYEFEIQGLFLSRNEEDVIYSDEIIEFETYGEKQHYFTLHLTHTFINVYATKEELLNSL